jgi:hypothetical protein
MTIVSSQSAPIEAIAIVIRSGKEAAFSRAEFVGV